MSKKAMLVILDGWGIGDGSTADAVHSAKTPFTDSLYNAYPHTVMHTSGRDVGLPDGQMGNSEVGHLNLGAGRVVWQMLEKINRFFIHKEDMDALSAFETSFTYCKTHQKPLHVMGLASDGGVHSSLQHLLSLIVMAKESGVEQVYLHLFTDGRDTDPKSGMGFISEVLEWIKPLTGVQLVSVVGRYYAMDRDKRWERTQIAYDCLVKGQGEQTTDILTTIQERYHKGETDEFLMPIRVKDAPKDSLLKEDDGAIFFNFRTDRGRQLVHVLTQEDMPEWNMVVQKLHLYTFTSYDKHFKNVGIIFQNEDLKNTLGEIISQHQKTQLRAAETEKYPHVTFFFSGGREAAFEGEDRIMAKSPKVATYDLMPEMSAIELTDKVVSAIEKTSPDFICLNFANPDMVGHTGVYSAIIKAIETVDTCVGKIVKAGIQHQYQIMLTADHGNADYAINDDGTPNTAHSLNPVPLWVINTPHEQASFKDHVIPADIAPTILTLMGLPIPQEMDGNVIF
jgi:2,3-bisphosphoglycerate-independent phosphoglycerate mutase